MYEELVKNLRSVEGTWQTQEEEWMLQAANAIEKLMALTANSPKWVSVKERLPDKTGEYIVTYHYSWNEKRHVGLDSFRGKTCWAKKENKIVEAWMNKPEPYEESIEIEKKNKVEVDNK